MAKYVGEPLGMVDTHFYVTDPKRLATPYADGRPPRRMEEPDWVVDDTGGRIEFSLQRIFNTTAPQSGGAGMAGTIDDVMKLLDTYNGTNAVLKSETVTEALANQTGILPRRPSDAGRGFSLIGAVITDRKLARTPCPVGAVDWGGVWGHNWIIDPVNRLTIITFTNVTLEGCMGPFREDIRDAVYG